MTYQDLWANGAVIESGYRECSARYDVVAKQCYALFGKRGHFVVRDLGCNVFYFGMRLTEDFPNCRVFGYESHYGAARVARYHLANHGNERTVFSHSRITLKLVSEWTKCDLILAMSILHHMPESQMAWIEALREQCEHLVVEVATEPKARNSNRKNAIPDYATLIGYGASHLQVATRPIYYMRGSQ